MLPKKKITDENVASVGWKNLLTAHRHPKESVGLSITRWKRGHPCTNTQLASRHTGRQAAVIRPTKTTMKVACLGFRRANTDDAQTHRTRSQQIMIRNKLALLFAYDDDGWRYSQSHTRDSLTRARRDSFPRGTPWRTTDGAVINHPRASYPRASR